VVVLIAYVDESYNRDVYFIAAAIGTPRAWDAVEAKFAAIRNRTAQLQGTPIDIELHGYEIMSGSGAWAPLRGKHREAAGVYRAALHAAREAGVRYVFRGVDVARLNARYRYPELPHTVVFRHVLERIDDFARRRVGPQEVIVVADEIATQDDHRRQFEGYQELGTRGYRSSYLTTISEPINFASSSMVDGLQAADLAAYIHRRAATVEETVPAAAATRRRPLAEIRPATVHDHVWRP
jgi:hypothetical protein